MKKTVTYKFGVTETDLGIQVEMECSEANPLHINPYVTLRGLGTERIKISQLDLETIVAKIRQIQLDENK